MNIIRTTAAPAHWSRRWLALWALIVLLLAVTVFLLSWWQFMIVFALGFGVPEAIGLLHEGDPYPPLTHVIRHFVAGWLAFPLLYGVLGSFGAKALHFPRWWAVGALFAGLGWITHHFMFTYINPDQFPRPAGETPEDVDPR